MIPEALIDNLVRRQLPKLIADAEALLSVAAWHDLPAGLRIIDCAGGRLAGFCDGSGHRFAAAHGGRPGAIAVAVAAEAALRAALEEWPDNLPAALGEAGLVIECVAAHEAAHALVADIDAELRPGEADILRGLPAAVGTMSGNSSPERTARDHGAAWAAGLVILHRRCRQYRPRARHRWDELLDHDLREVGIHPATLFGALGDVADEVPLRELLAPSGALVVAAAKVIPPEHERATSIANRHNTTPMEPRHVAPAAAGILR